VSQTSLAAYYVSYELNAYTKEPSRMAEIYSLLHQNTRIAYLPLAMNDYGEGGEAMSGGGEAGGEALEAYPAPGIDSLDGSPPAEEQVYPAPETKDETSLWQNLVDFFSKLLAWITPPASAHTEPDQTEIIQPAMLQSTMLPAGGTYTTTITYEYDPLYRLSEAIYSTGAVYTYTYDRVGNRTGMDAPSGATAYLYNSANQLTHVDGITHTWDANGNLLYDGVYTYTYDIENRLTGVSDQASTFSFEYNGLGERYRQSVDGETITYTLDIAAELSQILSDGDHSYQYGLGRIGQRDANSAASFFLPDALGSLRQIADAGGNVLLAQSFDPFGNSLLHSGALTSPFGPQLAAPLQRLAPHDTRPGPK
jgi:YD repeat-containing protein